VDQLPVAFFGGIGATITPCVLPLYPAFLAYLTGTGGGDPGRPQRASPVLAAALVWLGVVLGMVGIGAALAVLRTPLGDFNRVVLPVADGLLIVLGLLLLSGRNPFARLPQPSAGSLGGRGPALGALAYGLAFAPIAVPCSGPFLVAIFAFSLTIGDVLDQLTFFAVFGIGFGLPLFVLGAIGQVRGRAVARALVRFERPIQLIVGAALVGVGIWDLSLNLPLVLA
jgi:cytochrome c-type biogenesis protein